MASYNAPPTPPAAAGYLGPVALAGGGPQVTWRLHDGGVTFQVASGRATGWIALGIGSQMAGSHAYVAWSDAAGPRLDAYSIGSYDASSIQNASAEKVNAMSAAEVTKTSDGSIQFTFFRPLAGVGGAPTIAPSAVSLTWAFGTSWHAAPASSDQHNDRSSLPTLVNLARPAAPTPYPSCSWL